MIIQYAFSINNGIDTQFYGGASISFSECLASDGRSDYILTAMKHIDLSRLFDPRKLLIVGASDQKLFSAGIARYLFEHGFAERVTLVNAKGNSVFGRATHTTIASAASEGPFDLAIIVVAAPHIERSVEQLAAIGVKLAIVESAGFAETGAQGAARQASLKAKAEALVKELVKAGEVQTEQAQVLVAEIVDRSRRNTELLVEQIRGEIIASADAWGLATIADLDRIEKLIQSVVSPRKTSAPKAANGWSPGRPRRRSRTA